MRGKRILINPVDDYFDYKGEDIMAEITTKKSGAIEYKMLETMAQELLKTRKGNEFKMTENDFLCKVVNESFGLNGNCVKVIRH